MGSNELLALRRLVKSWRDRAKSIIKEADKSEGDGERKAGKYLQLNICATELQELIDG